MFCLTTFIVKTVLLSSSFRVEVKRTNCFPNMSKNVSSFKLERSDVDGVEPSPLPVYSEHPKEELVEDNGFKPLTPRMQI